MTKFPCFFFSSYHSGDTCEAAEQITIDNHVAQNMPNDESFTYEKMITIIGDGYTIVEPPSNKLAEEFRMQYEQMGMNENAIWHFILDIMA